MTSHGFSWAVYDYVQRNRSRSDTSTIGQATQGYCTIALNPYTSSRVLPKNDVKAFATDARQRATKASIEANSCDWQNKQHIVFRAFFVGTMAEIES